MLRTFLHAKAEFYKDGLPLAGGTLKFFEAGTSTPKEVFSDWARTASLGTEVTLDSQGRKFIVLGKGNYDVEVYDSDDVLVYKEENFTWDLNLDEASEFTAGDRAFFQQTTAPTGWTKITSGVDGRALRLVSGSVSSGGANSFTTAFNTNNTSSSDGSHNHGGTNATTLSTAQMPSHSHSLNNADNSENTGGTIRVTGPGTDISTDTAGGSSSHSHSISSSGSHTHTTNLDVLYIDVILCEKA